MLRCFYVTSSHATSFEERKRLLPMTGGRGRSRDASWRRGCMRAMSLRASDSYPCLGVHSEDADLHQINQRLCAHMELRFPGHCTVRSVTTRSCEEHKAVLDMFGRYPHRNEQLSRESTPEEAAWLANHDQLPAFAKSQQRTACAPQSG